MRTGIKRLTAAVLCLLLLCASVFAADYSGGVSPYSKGEVLNRFAQLAKARGFSIDGESCAEESKAAGTAYICMDAFVVGGGYVLYPMKVEINDGESAAKLLMRTAEKVGLRFEYGGSVEDGFYIRRVQGADITPNIALELETWLGSVVNYYNAASFNTGSLGEFDFTDMAGWMYFVNGKTPMVTMSDYKVTDGDVISVRFSLAYGMDIGCESFDESIVPYTEPVNWDGVTKAIAENQLSYGDCRKVASESRPSQEEIDELLENL